MHKVSLPSTYYHSPCHCSTQRQFSCSPSLTPENLYSCGVLLLMGRCWVVVTFIFVNLRVLPHARASMCISICADFFLTVTDIVNQQHVLVGMTKHRYWPEAHLVKSSELVFSFFFLNHINLLLLFQSYSTTSFTILIFECRNIYSTTHMHKTALHGVPAAQRRRQRDSEEARGWAAVASQEQTS